MITTLTLASSTLKKAMDNSDPLLLNEAIALSLVSIAESLNKLSVKRQAGAAASSESKPR
jgi:hypothetical protein